MMDINFVKGDIIEVARDLQVTAVAHGCNCFHTMGAGVAKRLSTVYPQVLKEDKSTPWGDINKLASFSKAYCGMGGWIYNLYTQYTYGVRGAVMINWAAFETSFCAMVDDLVAVIDSCQLSIAIPPIGTGLAGGDIANFNQSLRNAYARCTTKFPYLYLEVYVVSL